VRLTDNVIRRRAPVVDGGPYGNAQRDWDNATSQAYPAVVGPVSSTEDVVNQQQTITRWRIILGPYADLEATDRIEWDDGGGLKTYEVDGDVERHKRRGGQLHHISCVLMRVELAEA